MSTNPFPKGDPRRDCFAMAVLRYRRGECEAVVENAVDVFFVARGWDGTRREAAIREIVPLAIAEVDGCTAGTP